MKTLFIISLILTFLIVRISAHAFHDRKTYRKGNERSKTLTGFLRNITGLDIHHAHIGILILLICLPISFQNGFSNLLVIFTAIGTSLLIDQIFPLLNLGDYFGKKMLVISIILHLITIALVLII